MKNDTLPTRDKQFELQQISLQRPQRPEEVSQFISSTERRLSTQNSIFIKYIAQESNEKDILGRRKN